MKKILLVGPVLGDSKKAYGGGTGGYTRKMSMYLNHYRSEEFQQVPFFHTIRGQLKLDFFFVRFLVDLLGYTRAILREKPDGIHFLGQYRAATPREFLMVWIARLLRKPVLYEIKAGVFVTWYQGTNSLFRGMMNYILRRSKCILGQGMPYITFLKEKLNLTAYHHPNFVPMSEIPTTVGVKLEQPTVRILFIGFAFRDKGVFELVEACRSVATQTPVALTMIGQEHDEFKAYADALTPLQNFTFQRLGKLPHAQVLEHYNQNDLYCYPSRHKGEGHNNSINEAMMAGLVIITTRIGFLESVITEDRGYFLEEDSAEALAKLIVHIHQNRDEARTKARNARQYLLDFLTSDAAFQRLTGYYRNL